jgi:hypothetical protein
MILLIAGEYAALFQSLPAMQPLISNHVDRIVEGLNIKQRS